MLKTSSIILLSLTSTIASVIGPPPSGVKVCGMRMEPVVENMNSSQQGYDYLLARRRNWILPLGFMPPHNAPISANNVALYQHQIDNILKLQTTITSDTKRSGAEFTQLELGVGIAITQFAPKGEEGMLLALSLVFSDERAKAILKAIAEDV